MTILIVGPEERLEECKQKFRDGHTYRHAKSHSEAVAFFSESDLIFDFIIEENPEQINFYPSASVIFFSTPRITLRQISSRVKTKPPVFFGFNGLPTFTNREWLEVSLLNEGDQTLLTMLCEKLATKFEVVEDRVGLVTPRVICMIINEAYLTAEEGTASREDIDLAMKLGTNYPFGPFEWAQRIGVKEVYKLLEAIRQSTNDTRYSISLLLTAEAAN